MQSRYLHACALMGVLAVPAAMADEVAESWRRCAELEDDGRRLACYDRHASGGVVAGSAPAGASATAPEEAATSAEAPADRTAEKDFGRTEARNEYQPDEISATISRIQTRSNGERIFSLDNGQVWAEKSPAPSLRLEVGDTIRIKSGLFGSHRLFGSGKRSSGVDRVR